MRDEEIGAAQNFELRDMRAHDKVIRDDSELGGIDLAADGHDDAVTIIAKCFEAGAEEICALVEECAEGDVEEGFV